MANLLSRITTSDWLIVFLLVMQTWDFVTSYYVIRHRGDEENRVIVGLIERVGLLPALIISKLVLVPALLGAGYYLDAWEQPFGAPVLFTLAGWYAIIVGYGNTKAAMETWRSR